MGRGFSQKVVFQGFLFFDTPLHLGCGQSSAETDALLLRDVDGEILIPGTSIAGILRSRVEILIGDALNHDHKNFTGCNCPICELFGTAERGASKITVEDAYPVINMGPEVTGYRDGIGICRETQTTREGAKYDLETAPAGSTFSFELSVDYDAEDEKIIKEILYIGLEELCGGRVPIGGNATRGLGFCRLEIKSVYTMNFQDSNCLISFLKSDELANYNNTYENYFRDVKQLLTLNDKVKLHTRLEIDFDLILEEEDGLLVIKDGRYAFGDEPDIKFLKTKRWLNNQKKWVDTKFIPGASIKGPLRNRAEQILRTLAPGSDVEPCDPTESGGCGNCPVCRLFGYSKANDGRGLKSRLYLTDAFPLAEEILEKRFDFVAIDRFTGGALEKAKFDAVVTASGAFETRLIIEDPKIYELALVGNLFKDLYLKDIRFGYGKYKGFGKIKGIVREIKLLQTKKNRGIIADLDLMSLFSDKNGYWSKSGVWNILTIPGEIFRRGNKYKSVAEIDKLGCVVEIIKKIDLKFNDFINKKLASTEVEGSK